MAQIAKIIKKKLGELLLEEKTVKEEQVQEALKRQRSTGELLGDALVGMGFISEMEIARAVVRQFGLPYIDASRYKIREEAVRSVSRELMWQNGFIVLDKIGKTLLVAISGVLGAEIFETIEKQSGAQVFVCVSTASQIQVALQTHAPVAAATAGK